jgi:hypothetical protein
VIELLFIVTGASGSEDGGVRSTRSANRGCGVTFDFDWLLDAAGKLQRWSADSMAGLAAGS